MRSLFSAILKLYLGVFLLLTSLYCLLAYIPYTYFFLIKEPPYGWLVKFAQYHPWLYWPAVAAAVFTYWPGKKKQVVVAWALLAATAAFFTLTGFLAHIQNNTTSYLAGLAALLPLLLLAGMEISASLLRTASSSLLSYSNAVIAVVCIAIFSAGGVFVRNYFETGSLGISITLRNLEGVIYILAIYLWVALLVVSLANLLTMASRRITPHSGAVRLLILCLFAFLALTRGSIQFLQNMLNFRGWTAYLYGITLATALTGWGFAMLQPLLFDSPAEAETRRNTAIAWVVAACFAIAALLAPVAIGEHDWNGILQLTFTTLFWMILSICVFRLRRQTKNYSVVTVATVLLLGGSSYWAITSSAFLWARQLGTTDGAVVRAMENYAKQDVSFDFAYHWMDAGHGERCGELCLILRQYTNIPNPNISTDIKLTGHLTPTLPTPPNIFIIVIDSLRRDYVGAYNSRVDFTPNLDAFARDSVVIPNAYSQYAGTSLSEPAIWAGALLLHTHDWQSFDKLNSLRKVLDCDGYQMIVSYDEVLRLILPNADNVIKLDGDKQWNKLEIGDTLRQLKTVLDKKGNDGRPIFFYSQPKNVHQFASNDRPLRTANNWTDRPGFNSRIAFELHQVDESLGEFFQYLKNRGLYENSIIILTSDHGDATQELGRISHSTIIYPEVMQVPLIIHLPRNMAGQLIHDPNATASLIDITPTLYYLLGHKPIAKNLLFGRPLLAGTLDELRSYPRPDLFLASDARAAYGLLSDNGRYMYVTYDSSPASFLFDLVQDPNATQSVLTDASRKKYEQRVIEYLQTIAEFYSYKPNGNEAVAANAQRSR